MVEIWSNSLKRDGLKKTEPNWILLKRMATGKNLSNLVQYLFLKCHGCKKWQPRMKRCWNLQTFAIKFKFPGVAFDVFLHLTKFISTKNTPPKKNRIIGPKICSPPSLSSHTTFHRISHHCCVTKSCRQVTYISSLLCPCQASWTQGFMQKRKKTSSSWK